MEQLARIVDQVVRELRAVEQRKRARTKSAQQNFEYAVQYLLEALLKASCSDAASEVTVFRGASWYSHGSRYHNPNLTYRTFTDAFFGLKDRGYLKVTKDGYFDRRTGQGKATRVASTPKLLKLFQTVTVHPAVALPPDLESECIVLRRREGKQKLNVDYEDTGQTLEWRSKLRLINKCLVRHWCDLEISDEKVKGLQQRLALDQDREPIDLSRRTLSRIFANNSWQEGGRFYGGWWQGVPKEYRPYITIDGKRTVEYDYAQINPHIAYAQVGAELGEADAYTRVFEDVDLRPVVKEAFNAMLQASTELTRAPKGIDLQSTGRTWAEVKVAILDAHKPIEHLFFTGVGNSLQFEDSCLAEAVLVHFSSIDAPALPIHDSFIMHHGYGTELEEQMRKAFYERYGTEIKSPTSVVRPVETGTAEVMALDVDEAINGPKGFESYTQREQDWFALRGSRQGG